MLSLMIPARNAERRIAETLEAYVTHFSTEYFQDFEIIVVTNGCTDRTSEIVSECCTRFPQLSLKELGDVAGKGRALLQGFRIARGDTLAFVDADGSAGPEELHRLIEELGEDDGVIGSRWLPGSNVPVKQPLARRIASRGFNLLVRLLFGLPFKDTQCGAKVFRKRAIDRVLPELQVTDFAFDVELLYRLKKTGHRVKEVPITWEDKEGSTLNLRRAVPTIFLAMVRLRLLDSPFRWVAKKRIWGYIYRKLK